MIADSIFKQYDIRGKYGTEWDRDGAYKIGRLLPKLLDTQNMLVGRDARTSSEEIFMALSDGMKEAGCDVTSLGLCSTPALYFAASRWHFDGSVMITASHNPAEYNGLKVSRTNAIPVGYEEGLYRIKQKIKEGVVPAYRRGTEHTLDFRDAYLSHLTQFKGNIKKLKVIIDCSDGMAGLLIRDVVKDLDLDVILMYDKPDGTFPHHDPNPLKEENLNDLKKRVKEESADLGICFDGDADRVMFVDENSCFISPDLITALLAYHFFIHASEKSRGHETVLYDVRSSRSVVEFVNQCGGNPHICRVGHTFAKKLLRETDGIYGGELAGHYYFRENNYCDSGIIAALLVLGIISREQTTASTLISRIRKYHSSGEINFSIEDKEAVIQRVRSSYGDGHMNEIDGIRVDYATWWFNLRPSNTEAFLRLVVEASTADELAYRVNELTQCISPR